MRLILSEKKERSLRIRFAIEFKLFRMIENTFIAFAFYLLSILGVFGWTETLLKALDRSCYWFWVFSDERNTFEAFAYYFLIRFKAFRMEENNILKASDRTFYWFSAFSDGRKHFWSIRILFDIDFKRFRMNENTFEAFAFDLPSNLKWQSTLSCKQTLELDLIQNFQNMKVNGRFQWLKNIFWGKFLDIWNVLRNKLSKKNQKKDTDREDISE